MKRLKLLVLLLFPILLTLFIVKLFAFNKSLAAWFDDRWGYRTAINITNSGAAVANQKVKLDIDTAALYTAGKIQIDCDDSRFTDANGKLLQYYLDSANGACNTNSTDYYVLMPTINAGSTTIYHYYGNPSAPKGSQLSQFSQATFTQSATATAAEEQSKAPVAYWSFDDGQGSVAQDKSSNRNNGTLGAGSSAPTWQTEDMCVSGKCLKFSGGTNGYVNMGNPASLNRNSPLTISAWVKIQSAKTHDIVGHGDQGFLFYITNTNYVKFGKQNVNGVSSTSTISLNQWAHIAAVYNGSTVTFYINGTAVGSPAYSSTFTNSNNLWIGSDSANPTVEATNGFLDEVKIYPYARSAAEIKTDYNSRGTQKGVAANVGAQRAAPAGISNGLVGYWNFDVGVGGSAPDLSGNANTATFGTAPANPGWVAGNYGVGLSFDGNDYGTMGSVLNINYPITLSAWLKRSGGGSTYKDIVSHGTNGFNLSIYPNNTIVFGKQGVILIVQSTSTITDTTTWHHVVATYDGVNGKIYIDGALDKTTASSVSFSGSTALGIGNDPTTSEYFAGSIDEVRIYNRALSPAEVRNLYNWAPGPVGYWDFENTSIGTSVPDVSGYGNNGGWNGTGSPRWVTGKFGKAGKFNGTSDYVNTGSATSLDDLQAGAFTSEAWIKPTTWGLHDFGLIVEKGDQFAGPYWYLGIKTQANYHLEAMINCTTTSAYSRTNDLIIGVWSHVAMTYDNLGDRKIRLYVNGKEVSYALQTAGVGSIVSDAADNSRIGMWTNSYFTYNGLIDDVKIYNYARTQKQIIEDMNAGHPAGGSPVGSQVGYWKFDEGYGTVVHNSGSQGETLQGSLGTGSSAPTWTDNGKFGKALSFDGNDWVSFPDVGY